MPITLENAKNFTQSKLSKKVIDEFRQDKLLDLMVFDDNIATVGGGSDLAYIYDRVITPGQADFREINKEYTPQESQTKQYTTNLKILGGSFQVDRVIQNHVKGITNQISFQLNQKIKATKQKYADAFINGDSGTDSKSFDGIDKALTGSSTELVPEAAIDLTETGIDTNYKKFMDYVDKFLAELDGAPDLLLMNKYLRSLFNGIARRSHYFTQSEDSFGKSVLKYNGIILYEMTEKPGTNNPIIPINAETGETSLYAVRLGLDGVHGVTPDGKNIINTYLPDLKEPGAVKLGEVEFVTAVAMKATRSAGVLRKIKVKNIPPVEEGEEENSGV